MGLTVYGRWWLAERPENALGGIMAWSPDDGLSLRVAGSFEVPERGRDGGPDYPSIFGTSESGERLTLLDCTEVEVEEGEAGRTGQSVTARLALRGTHASTPDVRFALVRMGLLHLDGWAEVVSALEGRGSSTRWTGEVWNLPEAEVNGGQVGFELWVDGEQTRRRRVIQEHIALLFMPSPEMELSVIARRVWQPFQDLLTFAALAACPLVSLEVATREYLSPRWVQVLIPGPTVGESSAGAGQPPEYFLFRLRDHPMGFEDLVVRWFSLYEAMSLPLSRLLASDYSGGVHPERSFAEAVQAVEGYH